MGRQNDPRFKTTNGYEGSEIRNSESSGSAWQARLITSPEGITSGNKHGGYLSSFASSLTHTLPEGVITFSKGRCRKMHLSTGLDVFVALFKMALMLMPALRSAPALPLQQARCEPVRRGNCRRKTTFRTRKPASCARLLRTMLDIYSSRNCSQATTA